MPRVTEAQIQVWRDALAMRDNGDTYQQIANWYGLNSPSNARSLVNNGLRRAGRANEIRTRTVSISHNGRTTTTTVTEQVGFTMLQNYTFGIEFEIVNMNCRGAYVAMTAQGIDLEDNGYTHDVMAVWKAVPDASLTHRNGTAEVVSPVLIGTHGLTEIRTVAKVLRDANAEVNSSCGMHIHIGVDGALNSVEQARVIQHHQRWSSAFDALCVPRRINGQWARKITLQEADGIANTWRTSVDVRRESFCHSSERYRALNLNAFAKYGTFEFRTHQGSLNGMNATAWIAFHTAFIAWAANAPLMGNNCTYLANQGVLAQWTRQDIERQEHGQTVSRAAQIDACKYLAERLKNDGFLAADAAEYIMNRAGNIPTRATANNY